MVRANPSFYSSLRPPAILDAGCHRSLGNQHGVTAGAAKDARGSDGEDMDVQAWASPLHPVQAPWRRARWRVPSSRSGCQYGRRPEGARGITSKRRSFMNPCSCCYKLLWICDLPRSDT